MRDVRRDDEHRAARQLVARAVDVQFERAVEHADNLLQLRVLVLGERRAFVRLHPRMRHAVRVHEPRPQAGKSF